MKILKNKKSIISALILTSLLASGNCRYNENLSGIHWFLDMHDSHAIEAQEEDYTTLNSGTNASAVTYGSGAIPAISGAGNSMRVPPEGTVPRNVEPYLYTDFETAGRELSNPLPNTKAIIERGQKQYNIYCAVCHGYTGQSDGPVIPRFSLAVPNIVKGNAAKWPDGKIYHMISVGRGGMSSYAAQLTPTDRWSVIKYIRILQKTQ